MEREVDMPVFKYDEIKLEDVNMEGVAEVVKANKIGRAHV